MGTDHRQNTVPLVAFENETTRLHNIISKLVIAIIVITLVMVALLVASNGIWWYSWNQYDYVDDYTEISAEQGGEGVNIIGGGDVDYGTEGTDKEIHQEKNTP